MEALTRKVGGLPVWAWLGIAVVGYLAYKRYAAAKAAAASTTAEQNVLSNAYGNITGAPYAGWTSGASSPGQGTSGTSPGSGAGTPGTDTSTTGSSGAAGTVLATPIASAPVQTLSPQQQAVASVAASEIPAGTPPPTPQATIGTGPESQAITATANTNSQDSYWAHTLAFNN